MTDEELILILQNQTSIMEALTFLIQQSKSIKTPRLIAETLANRVEESEDALEWKRNTKVTRTEKE